jgi:hypothetical protein
MSLGWKVMLPMALSYIMIIATAVWTLDELGLRQNEVYGFALFGLNVVVLVVVARIIDVDRLIVGQHARRERRA